MNADARTLARLKHKLDAWELAHLRTLAADLANRLEDAEERASHSESIAEFWREQVTRIEGVRLGIDTDANLYVVESRTEGSAALEQAKEPTP